MFNTAVEAFSPAKPCPATYPVRVPQLAYETLWDTTQFDKLWSADGSNPFVLSFGDAKRYKTHADYMFWWKCDSLQRAMDSSCMFQACENRKPLKSQSVADMNKCFVKTLVKENIYGSERYYQEPKELCDVETIFKELKRNSEEYYQRSKEKTKQHYKLNFNRRNVLCNPDNGPSLDPGKTKGAFQNFELATIDVAIAKYERKGSRSNTKDAPLVVQATWMSKIAKNRLWSREFTSRESYSGDMLEDMIKFKESEAQKGNEKGKGKELRGLESPSLHLSSGGLTQGSSSSSRQSHQQPPPRSDPKAQAGAKRQQGDMSKISGSRGGSGASKSPSPGNQPGKRSFGRVISKRITPELPPSRLSKFSKSEQEQLLELCQQKDGDWYMGGKLKTYHTIAEEMTSKVGGESQNLWLPKDIFKELKGDFNSTNSYRRIEEPQSDILEIPGTNICSFDNPEKRNRWQPYEFQVLYKILQDQDVKLMKITRYDDAAAQLNILAKSRGWPPNMRTVNSVRSHMKKHKEYYAPFFEH
ncbi:hypothetical protein IFR05_002879 [Cadophora sp. M221]|nr:hypothetical protein IFR05_002879 [Cadophora sp. M221]